MPTGPGNYTWSNAVYPGSFCGATPSLLPFRFTDESVIDVPIPARYLDEPGSESKPAPERRRSVVDKLLGKGKGKKEEIIVLKMTRGEYLKYWARDDNLNYIGTEPEEEGRRSWRERMGK